MLEIEYKGRLIRAIVYSIKHRLKINSDNCNNEKPEFFIRAELLQEYDIEQKFIKKGFQYIDEEDLKCMVEKINELFEKTIQKIDCFFKKQYL